MALVEEGVELRRAGIDVRPVDMSETEKAEGAVTANIVGELAGVALPGGLSGTARCDEGASSKDIVEPIIGKAAS